MTWLEFKTEIERSGVVNDDTIAFIDIDRGVDRLQVDWFRDDAFGVLGDYSTPTVSSSPSLTPE